MSVVDCVTDRRVVHGHDGRSGARIETGRLGVTRVYVKSAPAERDLARLLTGSATRERDLFHAGAFDRLPPGVETALISVEEIDGTVVTISRDVGSAMLTWDRVLTVDEVRCIFDRMASVHHAFASRTPDGLCPLETRIGLFSPTRLDAVALANPDLGAAVRRGWELFADLAPGDIVHAVQRGLADPGSMAAALSSSGTTLLHGDFWLVNLALDGDVLIPLDWGLATIGPPIIDFVTFCVGGTANVDADRALLLSLARDACGPDVDRDQVALAELWALMELGWNKALDAVDHEDAAQRATARADLDFWVERARPALERGLVP